MVLEARPPDSELVQRTDRWRAVDGALTRMSETATPKIRAQFRREGKRVLAAIEEGADAEDAGELVDVEEWERLLTAIWIGFGKITFSQTLAELRALKQDEPDLEDLPDLIAAIGGYVALRAQSLVANTKRRLLFIQRRLITTASVVTAEALLKEAEILYGGWEAGRAGSIARHNVMAATAIAQHAAAVHSGAQLEKEWVSMQDGKVRPSHVAADGQIIGLEDFYIVGGEQLVEPRDPAGSPAETANCRCQEIYHPVTLASGLV